MYQRFFTLIILAALATHLSAGLIKDQIALEWVKTRQVQLASYFQPLPLELLTKKFPLRNYLKPATSHLANRKDWAEELEYGDESFYNSAFQQVVDMGTYGLTTLKWSFKQLMAFLEYMTFEINYKRASSNYHFYGVRRDLYIFDRSINGDLLPLIPFAIRKREDFGQLIEVKEEEKNIDFYNERMTTYTPIGRKSYSHATPEALKLLTTRSSRPSATVASIQRIASLENWSIAPTDFKWHLTIGHSFSGAEIPLTSTLLIPRSEGAAERYTGTDAFTDYNGEPVHLSWLAPHPVDIESAMEHIKQLFDDALLSPKDLFIALAHIHWWIVQAAPYHRGPGSVAEMLINIIAKYHNVTFPPWRAGVAPSPIILVSPDENDFAANYLDLLQPDAKIAPAPPDYEAIEEYQQALSAFLQERNLIIQDTSKDGDCFLHAISAQTGESKEQVRQRLIKKIKTLINAWQDHGHTLNTSAIEDPETLASENNQPLQLLPTMTELYSLLEQLENHLWVDVSMIYIVMQVYQQPLYIAHPHHQSGRRLETNFPDDYNSSTPGFNLIFTEGNHWTWALPGNNTQIDDAPSNFSVQPEVPTYTVQFDFTQ